MNSQTVCGKLLTCVRPQVQLKEKEEGNGARQGQRFPLRAHSLSQWLMLCQRAAFQQPGLGMFCQGEIRERPRSNSKR